MANICIVLLMIQVMKRNICFDLVMWYVSIFKLFDSTTVESYCKLGVSRNADVMRCNICFSL